MSFFGFNIQKAKSRRPTKLELHSDKVAGQISISLFSGITRFKRRVSIRNLIDAIKTNSLGTITKEIQWSTGYEEISPAFDKLEESAKSAGMISFEALPSPVRNSLRMDMHNPQLKKFISDRMANVLQDLSEESSKIVQRAIQRSFSKAMTPNRVAKEIMDHIGLNEKQSMALMNFQSSLELKNVPQERIDRMVENYGNRLLKQRAMTIARTEVHTANDAAQLSVWDQAVNEGLLDPDTTKKKWNNDRRPCDFCKKMNGVSIKLNQMWRMPDGRLTNVPKAHPNCECFQTLEI